MKPCILIPSYNSGPLLRQTLASVLTHWPHIFLIIDGSTDGSDQNLNEHLHPGLHVHRLPTNRGKGSAILAGITLAQQHGFTHALTIDADGQHPASHIPHYLKAAENHPHALILGKPIFEATAPTLRVQGRKISNWWANLETLWWGIEDSLFGMRLYPIPPLITVFSQTPFARRFDFDPEVAIRLAWKGLPILTLPTPVKYLTPEEGGISQFRYLRDNTLLTSMHIRLLIGAILRLPSLLLRQKNPLAGKVYPSP